MSNGTKPAVPNSPRGAASGRGERLATLGTVVSAILASSCCWVPLLLLGLGVLGVSTGGLARTMKVGLDSYRTAFTVVTFAFLGLAFYFTYRPRRAATSKGRAEDC